MNRRAGLRQEVAGRKGVSPSGKGKSERKLLSSDVFARKRAKRDKKKYHPLLKENFK